MGSEFHGTQRIGASERIASLDVLRGLAILFILFMNIPGMGGYEFVLQGDGRYPTWTTADWWSSFIRLTWLDGTQRGLLELLFGAGLMIMAVGVHAELRFDGHRRGGQDGRRSSGSGANRKRIRRRIQASRRHKRKCRRNRGHGTRSKHIKKIRWVSAVTRP